MPQLDLTTMSGLELRSLLDSARERGQAAQSYAILQEMQRRREAEAAGSRPQRRAGRGRRDPGEPIIIDVDLGDPLERAPEPWELMDEDDGFAQPAPPGEAEAEPPLTLAGEPEPEPERVRTRAPKAPKPPKPPKVIVRRGPGSPLGFALGGLAGIVLGLGVGGSLREALALAPELAEPAPMEVAAAPPPPVVQPPAAPPGGPELTEAVLPAEATAAEAAAVVVAVAPEPEPEPVVEPVPEAAEACAAETTPADRAICADPELRKLQQDLRRAYADALAAHEARGVLRQRQLAWRDARSGVSDPTELAALYESRIRKLEAATADARARR